MLFTVLVGVGKSWSKVLVILSAMFCLHLCSSVGEWIENVASHTERVNYYHLLQLLEEFEETAGVQQAREFEVEPDDQMQSLTIQLGSRLKCSLRFHI